MAPPRRMKAPIEKQTLLPVLTARKGRIPTRTKSYQDQNIDPIVTRGKRKADKSPLKNDKIKRSALGNLTNNVLILPMTDDEKKNVMTIKEINPIKKDNQFSAPKTTNTNGQLLNKFPVRPTKVLTRAAAKNTKLTNVASNNDVITVKQKDLLEVPKPSTRRISNEFEKTEDSLYMSAFEDLPSSDSLRLSGNFERKRRSTSQINKRSSMVYTETNFNQRLNTPSPLKYPPIKVPRGVNDFDKENWNDLFQVSHFAMDIFTYLKERELFYPINDYIKNQPQITTWMRSLLIDWMVEVQETFELNHETLYLAVKLVDLYLGKAIVIKDELQLLGASALFISCKFDERIPPMIEDFLYICDGAYTRQQIIKMEINLFKTVNYDLGVPLSYRFLRRYARCAKVAMPTLTLARYILELSLMDYNTITYRDSLLACAALFIALRMKGLKNPWNETLIFYSGYEVQDFYFIIPILNAGLHREPKDSLKTIRNKYSHKVFHEVAKVPLMKTDQIFANFYDDDDDDDV